MKCPACLREQEAETFCKKCLKELFEGKKVAHTLPFMSPYKEASTMFTDLTQKISLSGVQVKYSLKLEDEALTLTEKGGQYILKPIPSGQFRFLDQAPANEHLTMQLARQIYGIDIPPNAVLKFQDRSPAYLVKRFDVRPDGLKLQQEDFAQVVQITEASKGINYKYDLSYEEIAVLIRKYIAMYPVELEKFFRLVLFNYVFCNGDAHAKNFSVIRSETGDYVLTPAYDLLCTKLHTPGESDMALVLFKDVSSPAFDAYGFYTYDDFLLFGIVIGMREARVKRILSEFETENPAVSAFLNNSFLSTECQALYLEYYRDRIKRLQMKYNDPKG